MVKKHLNDHIMYYNFSFLIEKIFWNLPNLSHNLTYFSLFNSFLLLSAFAVFLKSLNNYFFRWLVTSLFSVNKLYYVVFLSFFCIKLFPTFFMIQAFQGPGFLVSGSRVWVQVLKVTKECDILPEIFPSKKLNRRKQVFFTHVE